MALNEACARAFDQQALETQNFHREAMEYLNRVYIKRTVEPDTNELAALLAGFNASDRTPVIKG